MASDNSRRLLELGRNAATVNRIRRYWVAFWRYAHVLGHCRTLPGMKKMQENISAPDAWNKARLARLFTACKGLSS